MGKLTTYMIMMSGLMLLFYFTGLIQTVTDDGTCEGDTPNAKLLNILLQPDCMREGTLGRNTILAMSGVGAVLIIAAGLFIGNVELAVMSTVAIYLFTLGWDFLAVFQRVFEVNPVFALLLFAPLLFFYVITMLEWWRGRD